jgi:zinc protease
MGTIDPGLLVINGRVKSGIDLKDAEKEVDEIINEVISKGIDSRELEKVKAQAYSTLEFGEIEVMNRAMNLAFAKLSGNADLVNEEIKRIESVTTADIGRVAKDILQDSNSSVMYYYAKKN